MGIRDFANAGIGGHSPLYLLGNSAFKRANFSVDND